MGGANYRTLPVLSRHRRTASRDVTTASRQASQPILSRQGSQSFRQAPCCSGLLQVCVRVC